MNERYSQDSDREPVAVSSPGGVARQFRVQIQNHVNGPWQMFAVFGQREQAEQCVEMLRENGYAARLIRFSIFPAAA